MPMFRKKPVEVEARRVEPQFDSDELPMRLVDLALWCGGDVYDDAVDGWCIIIETLEGQMKARQGDWIIKGVQGEFYPCKPDIFQQTYEAVGAQ